MNGYFISVFAICVCTGVLGLLSYNDNNKAERCALGAIILYVVISPIAGAVGGLKSDEFSFEEFVTDEALDTGYTEAAESALVEGVCRAIAGKFALSEEDISVKVYGFSFEEMCCDRVRVLLSGKAALADSKEIKCFVDEMGVGKCEIEIEIG